MASKDLYERLIRFYEFQLGRMPHREELKQALQSALTERDLRVFFLLPFFGMAQEAWLVKRAARAGIAEPELQQIVRRLVPQGVVDSFVGAKGRVYGRSPFIALLEFQVRVIENSPLRAVCSKIMDAFIEGAVSSIPTRTPYYRVLPVEETLSKGEGRRLVPINVEVPDPRAVLPIDVVSEMIRKESLITVADCYCRATKKNLGQDCGHPLETCFYFGDLALCKLEAGYARRIDQEEALAILRRCEEAGLVHNVSNCEGKIQSLCNCCPCSCGVLKAVIRGQTNVGAPSRFRSSLLAGRCRLHGACVEICPMHALKIEGGKLHINAARCIGCGLCVSRCPNGALRMVPREKPPRVYPDDASLFGRINREAMVGLVLRQVRGK